MYLPFLPVLNYIYIHFFKILFIAALKNRELNPVLFLWQFSLGDSRSEPGSLDAEK